MDIAVIPAYNPDRKLIDLVTELHEKGICNIIVVNDGSDEKTLSIFKLLNYYVTVLTHEVNKGKGAAIKTALRYIMNELPQVKGIVILDADGQHKPEDAIRLLSEFYSRSSGLVIGVRSFQGKIPLRSLFGNTVTKYIFWFCSGKWVSDTQTGLRAFSTEMIPEMLKVRGERYEYEMNVLLTCAKNRTEITEVPIATVYHDSGNTCSHFRTIRDSALIYGNIFAFSGASFLSFFLDYLMFFPLVWLFGFGFTKGAALVCGNIAARIFSAAFNYYLNSTFVFQWKEKRLKSMISYFMLACMILLLNSVILYFLNCLLGLNKALAKLITEMTLFSISFLVQKFIIFNHAKKEEAPTL
jgi:glycosyltransferase involved in cell wall biosynthesis